MVVILLRASAGEWGVGAALHTCSMAFSGLLKPTGASMHTGNIITPLEIRLSKAQLWNEDVQYMREAVPGRGVEGAHGDAAHP